MSWPPVRMTYSAGNQLETYQGQGVRFDADGNLVWGPVKGSMGELKFDSRNRLVEVGEIRYQYDTENQRIGVNGVRYVVNSQPALSQVLVREEGGSQTFYVYGLGLIGEEKEGRYRSYHFDVRGSTVALTNEQGEVVGRFGYGPYGELVVGEGTETPFLFNGQFGVMSDGNGLYYMRARFYSPDIKRFVNQDVLVGRVEEGQSLNRFTFVSGRPVSFVDPWGFFLVSPEEYTKVAPGTRTVSGTLIGWSTRVLSAGVAVTLLFYSSPVGEGSDIVPYELFGILAPGFLTRYEMFYNQFPTDEIASGMSKIIPNKMLHKINGTFNYVVTTDGNLIVGRAFNGPGGGHIDLANGQPVLAAGELKVINGQLQYVDNSSGHYQPSGDTPCLAIEEALKNLGFDVTGKYINKVWVPDPGLPRGGAWKPVK